MEGRQHRGHHYDDCAYDVVEQLGRNSFYVVAKVEAACHIGGIVGVRALILFAIGKMDNARDHSKHHHPHHSTDKECVNLLEGGHLLSFEVEHHQACNEDDHIEDKRHVHVDVDHAADHFTPPKAQGPVISGVVVNPKGHSEKEDEVGEDEVEYSDGGYGCSAGLHDVHHQAQTDDTAEQNHRVDDQKGCVVLCIISQRL